MLPWGCRVLLREQQQAFEEALEAVLMAMGDGVVRAPKCLKVEFFKRGGNCRMCEMQDFVCFVKAC